MGLALPTCVHFVGIGLPQHPVLLDKKMLNPKLLEDMQHPVFVGYDAISSCIPICSMVSCLRSFGIEL